MNEKERKTLIIISSVFIFGLVFMVFFTFYRRDAMLSDRTIPKINTDTNNLIPEEDPPSLGDSCTSNYTCSRGGHLSGSRCQLNCKGTKKTTVYYCGSTKVGSSTYNCGTLYGTSTVIHPTAKEETTTYTYDCSYDAAYSGTTCTSCDAGKYLSGTSCQTCPAGSYCIGGTASPKQCSAGEYSSSGARECSQCSGNQYSSASGATSCSTCGTGYHVNGTNTGCVADAQTTYSFCCNNNGTYSWYNNTTLSSCPIGVKTGDSSSSACNAHNSTLTPTATPTLPPKTMTCYKFASNTCTAETVSGSSCDTSSDYYSSWAECRENIVCGSGQYKYGNFCESCPSGKTVAYSGCQGNAGTCCVDVSSTTIKCYARSGSQCVEVNVAGSSCGGTGTNTYSSKSDCEKHISEHICWYQNHNSCFSMDVPYSCNISGVGNYDKLYNSADECMAARDHSCSSIKSETDCYAEDCEWTNGSCRSWNRTSKTCFRFDDEFERCELFQFDDPNNSLTSCPSGYFETGEECLSYMASIASTPTPTPAATSNRVCCCIGDSCSWVNGMTSCPSSAQTQGAASRCETSTPTTITKSCPAGQGADSSVSSGCSNCANGYYSPEGGSKCLPCGVNSHSNSNKSACECDTGYKMVSGKCTKLQDVSAPCCVTNSSGTKSTIESQNGCQQAVMANQNVTLGSCPVENVCPAGQGADSYATSGCSNCAKGTWSDEGSSQCYKCPSGFTTSTSASTSASQCIRVEDAGKSCAIASVTTSSGTTSLTSDGTVDPNSWYAVLVTVSGECAGKSFSFSATNGKASPTSAVADSRTSYSFRVYPNSCEASTATASINGTSKSTTHEVNIKSDWSSTPKTVCVGRDANPVGFFAADVGNYNRYYDDWGLCSDGVTQGYTKMYTRGGCDLHDGSGSPANPGEPTPDPRYCYVKRGNGTENQYCDNTESYCNGQGFTEKIDSSNCGESSACYLRTSDNTYVTGKYSGQSGYTYYGTSCPEKKCYIKKTDSGNEYKESALNPGSGWTEYNGECIEDPLCYMKTSDNSYVYGKYSGISGYTAVETNKCENIKCYIKNTDFGTEYVQSTANPGSGWSEYDGLCSEDDACYIRLSDNTYVTGKYKNNSGYKYKGSRCPTPGCYLGPNGLYEWGDFSSSSDYALIPSITDKTKCGYTPDVPKTSLNTQMIVYIATAIMSVAGIYFVVRYNSKSKNI